MIDVGNTLINVDTPTANRINGEMRDDVIPQDGTGTPVEEILHNDLYYSLIAIMNAAGITADDSEEGAVTSQIMEALDKLLLGAPSRIKIIASANYAILDTDTFNIIFISTGASTRTITLPLLANNTGKIIKVIKTGGTANVSIVPHASNPNTITIFGLTSLNLSKAGDSVEFQNQGSLWLDLNAKIFPVSKSVSGANYTILDSDNFQTIYVNSIAATPTITLPLFNNNVGKQIRIIKTAGTTDVIVAPNAGNPNTITNDALANIRLVNINDSIRLEATGPTNKWESVNERISAQLRLDGYTGYGSVDTKIPRLGNIIENYGNIFIENRSTGYSGNTEGLKITIQRSGKWSFSFTWPYTDTSYTKFGLSLNAPSTTTNISATPAANILAMSRVGNSDLDVQFVSWSGYLNKGDIVRPHTDGLAPTTAGPTYFTATYMGN